MPIWALLFGDVVNQLASGSEQALETVKSLWNLLELFGLFYCFKCLIVEFSFYGLWSAQVIWEAQLFLLLALCIFIIQTVATLLWTITAERSPKKTKETTK